MLPVAAALGMVAAGREGKYYNKYCHCCSCCCVTEGQEVVGVGEGFVTDLANVKCNYCKREKVVVKGCSCCRLGIRKLDYYRWLLPMLWLEVKKIGLLSTMRRGGESWWC